MLINASRFLTAGLVLGAFGLMSQPAQEPVPMKVTVTAGAMTETLRGTGSCGHEPRASLYGAPAALWLVEYGAGGKTHVSLRFWRFAAGDEVQFSLAVRGKKAAHRISNVKGSKLEGSGRATLQPTALGGRFQIAGKAHNGAQIQATIECARFSGIAAEGG